MSATKFRWSQVYESSEEELVEFLEARKINSKAIHVEEDDELTEQHTEGVTTIWCAEGSCMVEIDKTKKSLQPGDALRIDAGTTYTVHPGIANCLYYLSH